MRELYGLTGVDNKPTVILFNDTQIVHLSFPEDINNTLSSGEVSSALSDSPREDNIIETPDSMFNYLIERGTTTYTPSFV